MPVVNIQEVSFEHTLSGSALENVKVQIASAFVFEKALHQQMIDGFKSPSPGFPTVSFYLKSEQVILACAIKAGMKVPKRYRPTLEALLDIPAKLSLEKPLGEIDWIRLEPKHSGGFRIIHDFGPKHRALKEMVRRVVECRFVPRPFQFTFEGIRTPVAEAKKAILEGHTCFATLDIKNHFGSFHSKRLAAMLPMLPTAWVEYAVLGRHVVMKWKKGSSLHTVQNLSPTELLYQACLGIPAGSICSPIIGAHSISRLQWPDSSLGMSNYADNFLLLAPSFLELGKKKKDLKAAVGKLPGGNFVLKEVNQGCAKGGLDFLGHRLRLINNVVRIEPSAANLQTIYADGIKMGETVSYAMSKGDKAKAFYYVEQYCTQVKGWLAAFCECDDIEEFRRTFMFLIVQAAYPLQINIEDIMTSVEAKFEYAGGEYQYVSELI
jgi:hypothetical protein